MGFLDDVVGKVSSAVGGSGGEKSALVDGVLGLLSGGGSGGGLQGLVQSFKEKGLGDIVSSWVGPGQNLPIDAEQLKNGLGADVIGQVAAKAGISTDDATEKLKELLPSLVDKLTPDGKVPESGLLAQGLDFLKNNLTKG